MLRLNKIQCFLLGIGVIFIFYFLNRSQYIIGSEKVQGSFIFYVEEETPEGNIVSPLIAYKMKDSVYKFKGRENTAYEVGETVSVLLLNKDPRKPLLYTAGTFWLFPLVYMILPLIIWTAFSLSYINENEKMIINLRYPFFKKEKDFPENKLLE